MKTDMRRRTLLKGSLVAGVAAVAAGAGFLSPRTVMAAWPKAAFDAKKIDSALSTLLGSSDTIKSNDIVVKAPPIAEDGRVVNIAVQAKQKNVESISILVEQNAFPLAASFNMSAQAEPFIKTRIKVAKTSKILAVVKSDGKLYSKVREVKVTLGGCGG
jgi:sulfur-oxidizing protein SoxY